jgi:hypothetical protein
VGFRQLLKAMECVDPLATANSNIMVFGSASGFIGFPGMLEKPLIVRKPVQSSVISPAALAADMFNSSVLDRKNKTTFLFIVFAPNICIYLLLSALSV